MIVAKAAIFFILSVDFWLKKYYNISEERGNGYVN